MEQSTGQAVERFKTSKPERNFVTGALLERFLNEARRELEILRAGVREGADREEAAAVLHRWIGTAGLLGMPDVSQAAAETKTLLRKKTRTDDRRAKKLIAQMAERLGAQETPSIPRRPEARERVSAPDPKPHQPEIDGSRDSLWGVRTALVGLEMRTAKRCAAALDARGAFPRALDGASDVGRSNLDGFDLFVASANENVVRQSWREAMAATRAPIVWVGGRPAGVMELSRRNGGLMDFLMDAERPDELVARCEMLVNRGKPAAHAEPAQPRDAALEIVVADDDPTVNSVLEATLLSEGVLCHCAIDGGEALDLARRVKPDAIVLDVMMPRHDGFEVLAALKNDRETATIPVILLTARQREEDILRGFSLGADDYITKPFSPNEVLVRLRRLVKKNRFNARAASA